MWKIKELYNEWQRKRETTTTTTRRINKRSIEIWKGKSATSNIAEHTEQKLAAILASRENVVNNLERQSKHASVGDRTNETEGAKK